MLSTSPNQLHYYLTIPVQHGGDYFPGCTFWGCVLDAGVELPIRGASTLRILTTMILPRRSIFVALSIFLTLSLFYSALPLQSSTNAARDLREFSFSSVHGSRDNLQDIYNETLGVSLLAVSSPAKPLRCYSSRKLWLYLCRNEPTKEMQWRCRLVCPTLSTML